VCLTGGLFRQVEIPLRQDLSPGRSTARVDTIVDAAHEGVCATRPRGSGAGTIPSDID
jgi:hypothetical protein